MSECVEGDTMWYVYILECKDGSLYTGVTDNLERRSNEHTDGSCHTTLRMKEPKLVFFEAFISEEDARRREGYFKTTKGKKALKLMLRESLK